MSWLSWIAVCFGALVVLATVWAIFESFVYFFYPDAYERKTRARERRRERAGY